MNPFAVDINPTTSEGSKLYLKATEQWSTKDCLSLTIENGPKIREALDGLQSRFPWGRLISRITNEHCIMKDVIKNYQNLKVVDILCFNKMHLENGLSEALPSNQIMPALNPTTNIDHKTKFFNRIRSKIIAQAL